MTDNAPKQPKPRSNFSGIGRGKRSGGNIPSVEPSPEQDDKIAKLSRNMDFTDRAENGHEGDEPGGSKQPSPTASAIENGRGRRVARKKQRDAAIISIRCNFDLERRWKRFVEEEGYAAYHDALLDLLDHAEVPEYD